MLLGHIRILGHNNYLYAVKYCIANSLLCLLQCIPETELGDLASEPRHRFWLQFSFRICALDYNLRIKAENLLLAQWVLLFTDTGFSWVFHLFYLFMSVDIWNGIHFVVFCNLNNCFLWCFDLPVVCALLGTTQIGISYLFLHIVMIWPH